MSAKLTLLKRLSLHLKPDGASTITVHDHELALTLWVLRKKRMDVSFYLILHKTSPPFSLNSPVWHWVPHPADKIYPTPEECVGYEWMHTLSLYHTLRQNGGVPGTSGGPPLEKYTGPEETRGTALTNIILENLAKKKLKRSCSSSTADTPPESPKKRRRRSKQPETQRVPAFREDSKWEGFLINSQGGVRSDVDLQGFDLKNSAVSICLSRMQ